jgi:hypothetical protein
MRKKIYCFLMLLTNVMPFCASAEEHSQSVKPYAEFLYWRASETNSSWATTITFPTNTIDVMQSQPNFNTHAGVKVGLLYSPGDHFWDTNFYYTYYTTQTNSNIHLGLQFISSLFFSGSYFISRDLFFGGSSSWNITMNMADLEISHAFHPSATLSISPKIGLKGGTINQSININWNAFIYHAREILTNNFSGIGPSFGITADWNFINDFSLVGDISTALMYGKWKDNDIYRRPATLFTTQTTISSAANDSRLGTAMMDYYLGLQWRHHGKSDVTVRLGYEGQYWPNQLRLIAVQQLRTFGDLTFQGATCNVTIDF